MPYVPNKKSTLLVPSGSHSNPDAKHLFAIVTDKCADDQHLLVSFSTIKEGRFHDPTCVVAAGSHKFITNNSYVNYRFARIERADHLTKCVDGWMFTPNEDITEDLLARIQQGIVDSDFVAKRVFDYFAAQQDADQS